MGSKDIWIIKSECVAKTQFLLWKTFNFITDKLENIRKLFSNIKIKDKKEFLITNFILR